MSHEHYFFKLSHENIQKIFVGKNTFSNIFAVSVEKSLELTLLVSEGYHFCSGGYHFAAGDITFNHPAVYNGANRT